MIRGRLKIIYMYRRIVIVDFKELVWFKWRFKRLLGIIGSREVMF